MTVEERDALVKATEDFLGWLKTDQALDIPPFSLDSYQAINNSESIHVPAVNDDDGNVIEQARWDRIEHPEKDKAEMIMIVKALPGKVEKEQYGDSFSLEKVWSVYPENVWRYPKIRLKFVADRKSVCTPKVVGTKTEKVYKQIEVGTKEVDEIEWSCPPLLK